MSGDIRHHVDRKFGSWQIVEDALTIDGVEMPSGRRFVLAHVAEALQAAFRADDKKRATACLA